MTDPLPCWRCGAPLGDEPLPLSRRAECRACRAELHVCRMCRDYDPAVAGRCREERAEEVSDKEHANFCDWFRPRPDAYQPHATTATDQARAQLEGLFGGGAAADQGAVDPAQAALEKLFGG